MKKLGVFTDQLLDQQVGEIVRGFTPEAWNTPILSGLWVNYGLGFTPAGFYKDKMGRVHLRGLVGGGSGEIFILPAGYRPAYQLIFCVVADNALGRVDVTAAGTVLFVVGSNAFVSLDGISFRAES